MIIGIHGKMQHGKDTTAMMIRELDPSFEVKRFAGKLKERIALTWGIDLISLEDIDFKNSISPVGGLTWRQLMQKEGEAMRAIDKDYWVNALFADYKGTHHVESAMTPEDIAKYQGNWWDIPKKKIIYSETPVYPKWLIVDTRHPNEGQGVRKRDGILIKVFNPRLPSTDNHPSEIAMDTWTDWDYILVNDGTLQQLFDKVKTMMSELRI
jgi:hypothetical protein